MSVHLYLRLRSRTYDAKWTGTYTAQVRGRTESISASVQAPDAYQAGDKLRAIFEKKYGKDFLYPRVQWQNATTLRPGIGLKVAKKAGPEEE